VWQSIIPLQLAGVYRTQYIFEQEGERLVFDNERLSRDRPFAQIDDLLGSTAAAAIFWATSAVLPS
jgi:hypothetical protein